MKGHIAAIKAEFLKLRHSRIVMVTFIAFALGPLMGGIFMVIMDDPDFASQSSVLANKARMLKIEVSWPSFLNILSQVIGVGGVIIFGFVISWLFGREYAERTVQSLWSLPLTRTKILNAKFTVYIFWCLALSLSNLLIGITIGLALNLPGFEMIIILESLKIYSITTIMTILLGSPVAFFALWGRGYLPSLGIVVLTLVFAQVIAAAGIGHYFPWSVPGLYSGTGGEFKSLLNEWSYILLGLTSIVGYLLTIFYWQQTTLDH